MVRSSTWRARWFAVGSLVLCAPPAATGQTDKHGPVEPRSPQQTIAAMEVQEGYRVQCVASEPMVSEPVLAAWDPNGVMYVAQMESFMQRVDQLHDEEMVATSRVVRLEDSDGDGVMDKRSVFADNLLLPRILIPLDDRILIGETGTHRLRTFRDSDGDGRADQIEVAFDLPGKKRVENLEHQPTAIWSIENTINFTWNDYYLIYRDGKFIQHLQPPSGQWGIDQDHYGRIIVNFAQTGPHHFQFSTRYSQCQYDQELHPEWRSVWGFSTIEDFSDGTTVGRKPGSDGFERSLAQFTSASGMNIYRGDRYDADMQGHMFFGEPVARVIRRGVMVPKDGGYQLANYYYNDEDRSKSTEFIRCSDQLFRPVSIHTGPDGYMYIVDMYRGIIEESQWVGGYLKSKIQQHGLDKVTGRGRIYRVVDGEYRPGDKPNMLNETPQQWVKHLSHPNGWWRDTAQRLLVLKGDRSITGALRQLAGEDRGMGRIHALWTLHGLGALTPEDVYPLLSDKDPQVRMVAMRLSETFLPDDEQLLTALHELAADEPDDDVEVIIQYLNTLNFCKVPDRQQYIDAMFEKHKDRWGMQGYRRHYDEQLAQLRWLARFEGDILWRMRTGYKNYQQYCVFCHGKDGRGVRFGDAPRPAKLDEFFEEYDAQTKVPDDTLAPTLAGSPRVLGDPERLCMIVLHGLAGPIDDKTYNMMMPPAKAYEDGWLADTLSFVRNAFGNQASFLAPSFIAAVRERTRGRGSTYTLAELDRPKLPGRLRKLDLSGDLRYAINLGPVEEAVRFDDALFQPDVAQWTERTYVQRSNPIAGYLGDSYERGVVQPNAPLEKAPLTLRAVFASYIQSNPSHGPQRWSFDVESAGTYRVQVLTWRSERRANRFSLSINGELVERSMIANPTPRVYDYTVTADSGKLVLTGDLERPESGQPRHGGDVTISAITVEKIE